MTMQKFGGYNITVSYNEKDLYTLKKLKPKVSWASIGAVSIEEATKIYAQLGRAINFANEVEKE